MKKHIPDPDIAWLIEKVVGSFYSTAPGKGLPLGNLTSQLLVNVYMNEFDRYVKHGLRQKYYIRYADDFLILHEDRERILIVNGIVWYFGKKLIKFRIPRQCHAFAIRLVAVYAWCMSHNRLRDIRDQKGVTQERLADSVGVSRQTIISIEKGKYVPSVNLAMEIAKFFKLSVEDIFA